MRSSIQTCRLADDLSHTLHKEIKSTLGIRPTAAYDWSSFILWVESSGFISVCVHVNLSLYEVSGAVWLRLLTIVSAATLASGAETTETKPETSVLSAGLSS